MIRTIPDTISLIKLKYKRFKDVPLSWIERIGSKMNVYAWKTGTGYRDEVE